MAASRAHTTRSGGAHHDEEVKEQMSETIQRGLEQGKEMLVSATHDGGDKMLALALLLHAAVNMWQGWSLLWQPQMILPGLFGFAEKLNWDTKAQHALLRAFGFQTLAMGLVAGGAAFRYDTKHKAILNGVLLLFHALCIGDFFWGRGWASAETSGFRIGASSSRAWGVVCAMAFTCPCVFAHACSLSLRRSLPPPHDTHNRPRLLPRAHAHRALPRAHRLQPPRLLLLQAEELLR